MTPHNHKQGQGCPKCGNSKKNNNWNYSSWEKSALSSKSFDSFKIYFIECYDDSERFIKVGKTYTTLERRFNKNNLPYDYKVIKEIIFKNSKQCSEYEHMLHKKLKQLKYNPLKKFNGYNECFQMLIHLTSLNYNLVVIPFLPDTGYKYDPTHSQK